MLNIIGKITIYPNAVVNCYESITTNVYIVFKRGKDYIADAIVCAYYMDSIEYEDLIEEYPFDEYTIVNGDVYTDSDSDKQTIDLCLP